MMETLRNAQQLWAHKCQLKLSWRRKQIDFLLLFESRVVFVWLLCRTGRWCWEKWEKEAIGFSFVFLFLSRVCASLSSVFVFDLICRQVPKDSPRTRRPPERLPHGSRKGKTPFQRQNVVFKYLKNNFPLTATLCKLIFQNNYLFKFYKFDKCAVPL